MKGKYVVIRSADAGVFAGIMVAKNGDEVELSNARRLWYWEGAASLSQLSQEGVSKPAACKFPLEVPKMAVLGVCEILVATDKCRRSIAEVPPWKV